MAAPYVIQFKTETQGTESVEALRAKVLLMQQQWRTAAAEVNQSAKSIVTAQAEAAKAAIDGDQIRARAQQAAAATERAALDGLIAKERELKAALDEVSVSQARTMSGSMAATAAMRELQGGIPTRALGSFLANTLGLGAGLQSLIPILGLVAAAMEVVHLTADKSKDKTKELSDAMKELDRAYRSTADSIERYREQRDRAEKGPEAARADAANYDAKKLKNLGLQLHGNEHDIDEVYRQVAGPRFGSGAINRDSVTLDDDRAHQVSLLRVKSADIKRQMTELAAKQGADHADDLHDASEQSRDSLRHRAEVAGEVERKIDSYGRKELNPVEAIYARRDQDVKHTYYTPDERARLDAGVEREVQAELKKQSDAQAKDKLSRYEPQTHGLSTDEEAGLRRAGELIISALKQYNTEHNKSVTESGAEAVKANASRGAFADRMTGLNPQLSDAEKIAEIHRQDLETAQEKYRLELQTANSLATAAEQQDARHKADLANEIELQSIKERNIEQLAELQNKQLEQYEAAVGKLFDALASRRPGAITDLLRSEVMSLGKTITENLAKEIWPTIQKAIPHASAGTFAGKALGGTPFGPKPLKVATDANTAATQANTAALARLGGSGGGTVPTVPGGGVPGTGVGAATVDSGVAGDIGDGLPMASGPWGAGGAAATIGTIINTPPGSGFGFNASTIGTVAAAGAGVFAAISGFGKGGAGGALQGTGAVLGTAALFDPEPISKGILAGTALVTSLLGGFLNAPARRANAINTELGEQQYNAPTALNVTQSSGGTFADFDYRGNLRTSNFSPYPQVSEGYTWEQTHGLFDGPPTFYQVPGGQKSQFGAPVSPSVVNNHYYTISAIDTQSFNDALMKHHAGVGNAAAHNMQQMEGSLAAEVDRRRGR